MVARTHGRDFYVNRIDAFGFLPFIFSGVPLCNSARMIYQFVTIDDEVGDEFQGMALSEVSAQTLVDWMQDYFG